LRKIYGKAVIDIEACRECGGVVKVIACIEDPVVIEKILAHLDVTDLQQRRSVCPRAGYPAGLLVRLINREQ